MRPSGTCQVHVSAPPCLEDPAGRGGGGSWLVGSSSREVLAPGPHTLFEATLHLPCCPPARAARGMGRRGPALSLVSGPRVPASLSLSSASAATSQPWASSPALALTGLLSPLMPRLEGPSRKACRCPQSLRVRGPLSGRPRALRSSFAWPWSCLRGSRRSGSGGGGGRRRTYSGPYSAHSRSSEPRPQEGCPGLHRPPLL